ncbi:MAG: hypothetical protein NXI31_08220 [bacterium]|nr:hypothetical protein [bacterium]
MRISHIACLLLSSGLAAQTTVTMTAATPIAALTSAASGPTTFEGIGQGTPIGAYPNNILLSTNQSPGGSYLSASTIIYPTLAYQGGIGFNFFERAYVRGGPNDRSGSSASAMQNGATFAPHAVLATFSAAPGTAGNITISFRNSGASTGTLGAFLDIDDDGTREFDQSAAASFSVPYTFDPTGQVVVRVGNECQATGTGTSATSYAWTEVWVGFRPDLTATCNVTSYGQGCGGVTAVGSESVSNNVRTLTVDGSGCYANSPVIVATGSQQLSLPLLLNCTLLSNAEGVSLTTADALGDASISWTIPATLVGNQNIQLLPISTVNGALVLSASNGVEFDCFL